MQAEQTYVHGFLPSFYWPICPHSGSGEETAEHLCPRQAAERRCQLGYSIDIKDVFQTM